MKRQAIHHKTDNIKINYDPEIPLRTMFVSTMEGKPTIVYIAENDLDAAFLEKSSSCSEIDELIITQENSNGLVHKIPKVESMKDAMWRAVSLLGEFALDGNAICRGCGETGGAHRDGCSIKRAIKELIALW